MLRIGIAFLLLAAPACHAAQISFTAAALERTVQQQLFSGADGKYYLRGDPQRGCSISVADPHLTFAGPRVVLRVHAVAQIGRSVGGQCVGVRVAEDVDVSMLPTADGEFIGFTDVRLDQMSGSSELNFLLTPFLSRKIPQTLRLNAAGMLRKLLARSNETTGYSMTLDRFAVQSLQVQDDTMRVELNGDLRVE